VQEKLDVLIVGCGRIAGGFDMSNRNDTPITHAGVIKADRNLSLVACVDPDEKVRRRFMTHWGVTRGFATLAEAAEMVSDIDLVTICSPTSQHYEDVCSALELRPTVIFCEKPVTSSSDLTNKVIQSSAAVGCKIAVNYTRRWDPSVQRLKDQIQTLGEIRSIVGFYNKGILNNGTHMLDLIGFLFGDLVVDFVGKKLEDYDEDDPTVPVLMHTTQGLPVHLTVGHAADFSLFELQIVAEKEVIVMKDGGSYWLQQSPVASKKYSGYRTLGSAQETAGEHDSAMRRAYENIYLAISTGVPLQSDCSNALKAQVLAEKIRQLATVE
jgi:predicted dehydrogenase